jgi:antitoxin (DNA-binding transcriptional repressor) of toxin-antitoxin stability system
MDDTVVSLRELNHHPGRIVRRVKESGHAVAITDRGAVIARIVPEPDALTPLEQLRRSGLVEPARRSDPLPEPVEAPSGRTSKEILDDLRGEW